MPIHKKYAKEISKGIEAELRTRIFGSLDFMSRLDNDDDWSFVIKVQALIEAAVTEAVIAKVGEGAIQGIVERLPLADKQVGKLALAKQLNLMSKEQLRFVRRMAELRNRLAHRVQDLNFNLSEYVDALDQSQLRDWKESVAWFAIGRDDPQPWLQGAKEKPRLVLYFSVVMLLSLLHLAKVEAETPRKIDAAALRTAEELFASFAREPSNG
ncbi:MAG TPA: hypothetical protein VFV48_09625 [Pseudomonadales bacterium]|nr:hypothetical protein [Pseudomonadales bacterium]